MMTMLAVTRGQSLPKKSSTEVYSFIDMCNIFSLQLPTTFLISTCFCVKLWTLVKWLLIWGCGEIELNRR